MCSLHSCLRNLIHTPVFEHLFFVNPLNVPFLKIFYLHNCLPPILTLNFHSFSITKNAQNLLEKRPVVEGNSIPRPPPPFLVDIRKLDKQNNNNNHNHNNTPSNTTTTTVTVHASSFESGDFFWFFFLHFIFICSYHTRISE